MYFRFFKLIFRLIFFRYKVDPAHPFEQNFRVGLTDIDFNGHITNALYASFIDLVSLEVMVRSGTFKIIKDNNMHWLLSSSYKRYRRDLKWNVKFTVSAQVVYIGEDSFYVEYKFLKDGFIHCHCVDKYVLIQKGGGKVSPHILFPWAPDSLFSPPLYIADLIETESEFQREVRKD